MNLIADMKILHVKKFKEGSIRQATFLKSFKKEILELIDLDYKPSEIRGYLEEKLDVKINMNTLYAWLNYTTKNLPSARQNQNSEESQRNRESTSLPIIKTNMPESTLDILSSTDFD